MTTRRDNTKNFEKVWKSVREDGAWIDAGENDNLIVQKLEANPKAVGIFGYSFLEENTAKIKGAKIGGVEPDYRNDRDRASIPCRVRSISTSRSSTSASFRVSRSSSAEYVSAKAIGEDGYLSKKGLIALPKADRDAVAKTAAELAAMAGPSS